MDELWSLIFLCFAMLCGCYLAGIIPLAFSFSEERFKLVTVFGAGLLIGTSLAVIIPEAVHTMYSTETESHHSHADVPNTEAIKSPAKPDETDHAHHEHNHSHGYVETHTTIGVSLVIGFVFMLIVDQVSGGFHMHSAVGSTEEGQQPTLQKRNRVTATLGLVVHAAADGIALGAAVKTAEVGLTLIIFIAIMLHKAPAAFGLVSFLLHDGFDRARIRRHLSVFSLAAPVLAIITYLCLNHQSKETLAQYNTVGIAMLFSAGTFLYVATVHILPEITSSSHVHQSEGMVIQREHKGLRTVELVTMVIGSIIPVLISLGHSH